MKKMLEIAITFNISDQICINNISQYEFGSGMFTKFTPY